MTLYAELVEIQSIYPLVSVDCKTGGYEELVVLDRISVTEAKYILIIEAVTTGGDWRMLSYDGRVFKVTNKIEVILDTMARNKEKWMKEFTVLVDCVYAALGNGGIVKDVDG